MKRSIQRVEGGSRQSSISRSTATGVSRSSRPTIIGHDIVSEEPHGFTKKERGNHTHVIGSTGTGKSKFLELMLRQDMLNQNCGACLLDPHGKLYYDLLNFAASQHPMLAERIVVFNPFNDLDNIMGFNPIPHDKSRIDYIEKTFIESCLKAWGQQSIHETPRIAHWLQVIVHTLLVNDLTLLESVPLLSTDKNDAFRKQMIKKVVNETVTIAWNEFQNAQARQRREMLEGAGNRLLEFLQNEIIRLVIGQQGNVLDIGKIMDEGKILLINLNDEHGRVTHTDATFLGTMIVSELHRQAKLRDVYDPALKPFYVYIDEFGQYVTRDIGRSLEEVRKFKVSYVLSHQHLSQLKRQDDYLYASVLTNCKNKVVFGGLSEEDVDLMNKEINTGFLDLKAIKHEQMRIRERHIETVRKIRQEQFSQSQGNSTQKSRSETDSTTDTVGSSEGQSFSEARGTNQQTSTNSSTTETHTVGSSDAHGVSRGTTDTSGESSSLAKGKSRTDTRSQGLNFSRSNTEGTGSSSGSSHTNTDGRSKSVSNSETATQGSSSSDNWSESSGEAFSVGQSESRTRGRGESSGGGMTHFGDDFDRYSSSSNKSEYESSSSTYGDSRQTTNSSSNSRGGSTSRSDSVSQGQSITEGSNKSSSVGHNESRSKNSSTTTGSGEQWGKSSADGVSETQTRGTSSSQAKSCQETDTHTDSQSRSQGTTTGNSQSEGSSFTETEGLSSTQSQSQSKGRSVGVTEGEGSSNSTTTGYSEGYVPFLEPQEVEEVASVQFWTRDDMMYMAKAAMKNLATAQAVVKVESNPPMHCQVLNVPEPPYSRVLQDDMRQDFQEEIYSENPELYLPLIEAKKKIAARQTELFQDTLKFMDTLLPDEDQQKIEDEVSGKNAVVDGNDEVYG